MVDPQWHMATGRRREPCTAWSGKNMFARSVWRIFFWFFFL